MKTALAVDPPSEEPPPAPESGVARQPCVMLAEDDREMRMLVATSLRRAGYDVIEAADGIDLLDCIAWVIENRDDWMDCAVVSDIRMPALNGLEALERLRGIGWSGGIILITAFGDEATHARARELGVATVLDKPFDLDALYEALRAVRTS